MPNKEHVQIIRDRVDQLKKEGKTYKQICISIGRDVKEGRLPDIRKEK